MKHTVKVIAVALVGALALGLAGCHMKTPATVMNIEGVEISAGVYLLTQMQAYKAAAAKVTDEKEKKNVLKATIEEQTGEAWVHAETLRTLRRYAYLDKAFTAQGLAFTEEEKAASAAQIAGNWSANEKMMAANGIGQASYTLVYENELKYEKLFTVFATEHKAKLTDAETKAYMDKTYTHVSTMTLPVTKEDNTALEEADQKKIIALADELKGKLSSKDKLETLAPEYLKKAFAICGRTYTDDLLPQYVNTTFITEEYTYFPADLLEKVLAAKVGAADVYMMNTTPMLYQKIANYADDTEFMQYKDTLQNGMSAEAFDAKIAKDVEAYTLTVDDAAVRTYSPKKIKLA